MMKEAETDSLVSGCLQGRQAGFMQTLSFEPFDPDNAQDVERAEWYKGVFRGLKERSLFKTIINAKKYGYQVLEFEWETIDLLNVPVKMIDWDQKYFTYDVKGDGKLKVIGQKGKLDEIHDEAIIIETKENPILLPVLKDFILKEFGVQAWASFIETFGEGFIIGYYPPGSDPTFRKDLDDAVKLIGSSTRGTAPEGSSIEVTESQRNTGDHDKFVSACEKGLSLIHI